MRISSFRPWIRACATALTLAGAALLPACSSGGDSTGPGPAAIGLDACDAATHQTVLAAVPAASVGGGAGAATSLTVHYRRLAGDHAGWTLHTFLAAVETAWAAGLTPTTDSFGGVYEVALKNTSGEVGYIFHKGDTKDHGGTDQKYTLKPGKNEIWRIEGDSVTYASNPLGPAPDLTSVRVHYKRYDANFAPWGVHIWAASGLDVAGLKPGVVIDQWPAPVAFSDFNNFVAGVSEVAFEIPVLNPKDNASRKSLEFIIHGTPGNPAGGSNNKDGRNDNIRIDFAALSVTGKVADVWIVQEDATVYTAAPDLRSASTVQAKAVWLNRQLIQWPRVDSSGVFKLYHSASGQIQAAKDGVVSGADGSLTLDASAAVPAAAAARFKYVLAGVVVGVKDADLARLGALQKKQLVVVQEDASGKVQNAAVAQVAGALDELYAAANSVTDLGVSVQGGNTRFKLWAPSAQAVSVCSFDTGSGKAVAVDSMGFDATTGVWAAAKTSDLSGKYYKFIVDVFVRGVGLVRNGVTDPYSISLTTDSKRSYIADLGAANLKPAQWETTPTPTTVVNQVDMTIYELHVRDFSASDASVPEAHRGKFMAFTDTASNGMKHLKALADAGLTDVHLLPVFDIATVPEAGCAQPNPGGAADGETQQAAIGAVKDSDCFNWGYDPYHFTAPEGSYATDAADGAKRIVEFRQMVTALHQAGLRVGMDVVYNHTTASGQNERSVLDRVVPGYYHRLDASGSVEKSTCCDNTATENMMMGKLMTDSVLTWATQYKIDSFRFDLMAHQPRSVMQAMKAALAAAAGREIHLIGEGWNFGEVQDGARFVQASQLSLNGSGIGTFSDRARDYVRGGGPFDGGISLVKNQGYISGLFYDDNGSGAGKSATDLMLAADVIKVGLAGSIRDYTLTLHGDDTKQLQQIDYNGQPAAFVVQPQEVVNYVENHDNQTLFDINVYKLPLGTSQEDRARVQMLGAAINAFSQGVSYFHAGIDTLRSKSMDRNSYNSGDWFNRLDWTYADNNFGVGAPPQGDNGDNWAIIKPLLADPALKPTGTEIALARDMFRDLLKLRASSTLFRLRTADDIKARLKFYNTGSAQLPSVIVGHLDGSGYAGAGFKELMYLVNVDKVAKKVAVDAEKAKAYTLHPVHASAQAADKRAANDSSYDAASGRFTVPPRTAVVYVVK